MTVYVVMRVRYTDHWVHGVFTTLEAALASVEPDVYWWGCKGEEPTEAAFEDDDPLDGSNDERNYEILRSFLDTPPSGE